MTEVKPDWLKIVYRENPNRAYVEKVLAGLSLHTVCGEANCPNYIECFNRKTATFMILGKICTRNCRFCNVTPGTAEPIDAAEPENVANAVRQLGLNYVVVTSVTRDDLPHGGAEHFAAVICEIKRLNPVTSIEVLIPDFGGSITALKMVADAAPAVISHNVETVPRLYAAVRPQAVYQRSLEVLANVKHLNGSIRSKTGLMVGLGETRAEMIAVLKDIRSVGCEFLTIGQYLAPSKYHYPVAAYIHPDTFLEYKTLAYELGFIHVAAGPYVRSSYRADEAIKPG